MMMEKKLLILIADPNAWFSYGLAHKLLSQLSVLGWDATITNRLSDKREAAIIFAAWDLPHGNLRLLTESRPGRKKKLFFIIDTKNSNNSIHNFYNIDGVIFRHQSLEEIMTLVAERVEVHLAMLSKVQPMRLSPQEVEVMRYFNEGYCPKEIAMTLGINVKTVSRHKRSVMDKLDMFRPNELYLWLVKGGLNDI